MTIQATEYLIPKIRHIIKSKIMKVWWHILVIQAMWEVEICKIRSLKLAKAKR
jgi:hypothetical protein